MGKVKVCFFVHLSMLGGAERSMLDLMRLVSKKGVECSVVMQGKGSLYDTCVDEGFVVKSVPTMAWWCYSYKDLILTVKNDFHHMVEIVKELSPDIIYTQTIVNPFGAMVAEELELPHIWALREYGEKDHKLNFELGYRDSMQAMFHTSDAIFSVSRSVAEVVLQENADDEKVYINYSSVQIPNIYKDVKTSYISKDKEIKIGIFGSVTRGKNQKDIIEAVIKLFKEGYNVSLTIVGQREEIYYKELCAYLEKSEYREKINFKDFTDEPLKVMQHMDIVVSCAESEAMGRTLFEAIRMKKPIVYANSGGFKEVFKDEIHGLGYRVYDSDELVQKLQETIEDPDKTVERIESAYKYVNENFTDDRYSSDFMAIIKYLRGNSPKRKRSFVTQFVYKKLFENFEKQTNILVEQILQKDKQFHQKTQELKQKEQQLHQIGQEFQQKEQQIQNLNQTVAELHAVAQSMRIKNRLKRGVKKVVPQKVIKISKFIKHNPHSIKEGWQLFRSSGLGAVVEKIKKIDTLSEDRLLNSYHYVQHVLSDKVVKEMRAFRSKPLISIIMPVYNVDPKWLKLAINSVKNQWYENWELCIVDDKSTNTKTIEYLKSIQNEKIKIKFLEQNLNISGASNVALKLAGGEYIALMDNDDELTPDALYEVVKAINEHDAEFIYSDEDFVSISGEYSNPHFKPDFSPDLLLSHNYITHFACFKKSILDKVGYFMTEFDGAQDYDLFLRLTEHTSDIYHIQKVLYHWRTLETSTSANAEAKPEALERGKHAVEKALQRRGIDGYVENANLHHYFRVRYTIKNNPLVSIVIPFKDKPELLEMCICSILEKSSYQNYEIIGISNNSEESETFKMMKALEAKDSRISFYEYNVPFNYSDINNHAVNSYAKGSHILLLNNDIEIISSEWIESMLELSQREEVGCVGAKLYYPDDTIQHAGIIIGLGGYAGHSHKMLPRESYGYFNRLNVIQNFSAVTAACLMVKKSIYVKVGGLDEEKFKVAFNDVDFCLRVREKGYLNLFSPYCEAHHHESISRGYEESPEKIARFEMEKNALYERHKTILQKGDPYYNPNLTLDREDFSLK